MLTYLEIPTADVRLMKEGRLKKYIKMLTF